MKRLSYRQALVLLLTVGACGWYLRFFWGRVLWFYGITSPLLYNIVTLSCLAIGLVDPIPVKPRTVVMMYVGFYGIVTDVLTCLIAPWAVWQPRSGLLVALFTAASILYGYAHGKKTARIYYLVPSPLSRPLRIALLSDIHTGLTVDEPRLQAVMERIQTECPDLLVIAGDLCDDVTSPQEMLLTARLLGSAGVPTFSVLGNHDLGFGKKPMQYTETDYRQALQQAGIRLLDDETADLGELLLLGRRDRWMEGRKEAGDLPPLEKPCIVIDHQPFSYKEHTALGAFLQLSGHTHAAQVFPLSWLGRVLGGFYGLHRHKGITVITSCGLGNRGNRMRSGCTAEYVVIDLVPEKGS